MAELQLLRKDQLLRSYPLRPGGITIGRAPDNQIHLDSPAVGERHARVFTVGRSSVIQDLGSDSGTYINDQQIGRQTLRNDDVVQIGNFRLRYLSGARVTQSDTEQLPDIGPAEMATKPPGVTAVAAPESSQHAVPVGEAAGAELTSADHSADQRPSAWEPPPVLRSPDPATVEPDTLAARTTDNSLDDSGSAPSPEVDLELNVDSEALLDTAEIALNAAQTEELPAVAGDSAETASTTDSKTSVPGDEAGSLVEPGLAMHVAGKTMPESASESPLGIGDAPGDEAPAVADSAREEPADAAADDPAAAAIRERIRTKVNAYTERKPPGDAATLDAAPNTPVFAVEEAPAREEYQVDETDDLFAADLDTEPDTILELLPERQQPRTAAALPEPADARATLTEDSTADPDAATNPARRERSLEIPAPPDWSLDADSDTISDSAVEFTVEADTGTGSVLRHQYAAIDILNGPNAGLRIWLGKPRTFLGNRQERALVIQEHHGGYRAAAVHRGATVTLNGTLLLPSPENLQDGDHLEFANMSVKFLLTTVRPMHPSELDSGHDAGVAPAATDSPVPKRGNR